MEEAQKEDKSPQEGHQVHDHTQQGVDQSCYMDADQAAAWIIQQKKTVIRLICTDADEAAAWTL